MYFTCRSPLICWIQNLTFNRATDEYRQIDNKANIFSFVAMRSNRSIDGRIAETLQPACHRGCLDYLKLKRDHSSFLFVLRQLLRDQVFFMRSEPILWRKPGMKSVAQH